MYVRKLKPEEFFELNAVNCTKEFLAENTYILIHTLYLDKDIRIKREMGKKWQELFGVHMKNETFEYLQNLAPVMLRNTILEETRRKEGIPSLKYIVKSVAAFEFDLWLIEKYRIGGKYMLFEFEAFIHEKYGKFLNEQYGIFRKNDLKNIPFRDLGNIAKALEPYYDKILEMFQLLVSNNRRKIQFDDEGAKRTKNDKRGGSLAGALKAEAQPNQPAAEGTEGAGAAGGNDREYQIILKERDERIAKLEKDIKEYKRQRDEAREYSANQYDRGIKDLFQVMNDARYGKVIDYLYAMAGNPDTEENLASYLDNLFMAFEDMEIEPIAANGRFNIQEESLLRDFNLEFDKSAYDAGKVRLKHTGWKYKDVPMEKPTLTLESS